MMSVQQAQTGVPRSAVIHQAPTPAAVNQGMPWAEITGPAMVRVSYRACFSYNCISPIKVLTDTINLGGGEYIGHLVGYGFFHDFRHQRMCNGNWFVWPKLSEHCWQLQMQLQHWIHPQQWRPDMWWCVHLHHQLLSRIIIMFLMQTTMNAVPALPTTVNKCVSTPQDPILANATGGSHWTLTEGLVMVWQNLYCVSTLIPHKHRYQWMCRESHRKQSFLWTPMHQHLWLLPLLMQSWLRPL